MSAPETRLRYPITETDSCLPSHLHQNSWVVSDGQDISALNPEVALGGGDAALARAGGATEAGVDAISSGGFGAV